MSARSPLRYLATASFCLLSLALTAAASVSAELTPPLSVQWTFSMPADPRNTTTPLVQGDRVFLTHLGTIRCLDARTGAEQWNFSPDNGSVATSPVAWEGLIIVGATDENLYALDAAAGDKVWERGCAGPIVPDPLVLNDLLMVGAAEMVYAIQPSDGAPVWVCSLANQAQFGPVTDGSMLYFLCQDTSIQCVDAAAGRYRWRKPFTPGARIFDPVVGSRRVIVATGSLIHGFARSSSIAWSREMPAGIRATPVLADDILFVPCVDGQIYTLYARSGALSRGATDLEVDDAISAPPLVTNTLVAAGGASGLLYLLDRDSGEVLWSYRCLTPDQFPDEGAEFGIHAPIVGAGDSLYCLTGAGDLFCFSSSSADVAGPAFAQFTPEGGSAQPSGTPLDVSVAVTDVGSGVNPSSVRATLDGVPIDAEFEPASGLASLRPAPLSDGPHIVSVTASDYRGNVASTEWSFLTDASLKPPPEERPQSRTGLTGRTQTRTR
jgi:outer membrane protein assembly factor BamB